MREGGDSATRSSAFIRLRPIVDGNIDFHFGGDSE